jgi:hypothetical protein
MGEASRGCELEGWAMDIDNAGNLYVAGRIAGGGQFGKGEDSVTVLNTKIPKGYMAKYSLDGTLFFLNTKTK